MFVDATGIRRRRIRRAGVLVAVASLSYLPMAATALLPGPPAPAQPAPLFVGDRTGEQPRAAPPPLGDPHQNLTPEPEDTVDGPQLPADRAPAPDDMAPTTEPSINPTYPEPSHSADVLPTGRPSTTPMPPTSSPTSSPTSPPAPLPEGSTPPVTASPTMSTPAEPSPGPVATRPITLELAPWVAG
ncbi:hypothetical protein [Micromonospora sp. NBC_01638]|uniref:hypothetical protein n=1 Tax=Micromonospora sp. NBC_01638 TaxID=2975982 RepID=UPI0038645F6E|nr:hypothetical protein OG811_26700 [Micromonospora sp. NBC_01638]